MHLKKNEKNIGYDECYYLQGSKIERNFDLSFVVILIKRAYVLCYDKTVDN